MGGFTPADLEGAAEEAYRRAGFELDEGIDPVGLAEALLGDGCVRAVHAAALPGAAALARVGGEWRIYVRGLASAQTQRWAVAHELGHLLLGADAPEWACDAVAGALLAPRRAFAIVAATVGADWRALASHFGSTESWAALRWGEATREPVALVTPLCVRVRGDCFAWPETDSGIRALAAAGRLGLSCARLSDARRVVIRPA